MAFPGPYLKFRTIPLRPHHMWVLLFDQPPCVPIAKGVIFLLPRVGAEPRAGVTQQLIAGLNQASKSLCLALILRLSCCLQKGETQHPAGTLCRTPGVWVSTKNNVLAGGKFGMIEIHQQILLIFLNSLWHCT